MHNLSRQTDERFPLPVSEKAILKRAVRRFPKCLRNVPNWFVTEPREVPGSAYFGSYSPVTLERLRFDQSGDYSRLDYAMQTWKDHGHWIDRRDRKSTRLNSSHLVISYAVFCLKK